MKRLIAALHESGNGAKPKCLPAQAIPISGADRKWLAATSDLEKVC
jgi:hypothetical protein